jgi:hypothetical protein
VLKIRLLIACLILVFLSACGLLRPNETAMQTAISHYVVQEEDYPRDFVIAENFVFRNLQKIEASDPAQYQVEAEFDITYSADGDVIVQALELQYKKEREKEKQRTNNPLEELKGAVTGALSNFRYEQRFKNVRKGDQYHFSGEFIFTRNADNSWRVSSASYQ